MTRVPAIFSSGQMLFRGNLSSRTPSNVETVNNRQTLKILKIVSVWAEKKEKTKQKKKTGTNVFLSGTERVSEDLFRVETHDNDAFDVLTRLNAIAKRSDFLVCGQFSTSGSANNDRSTAIARARRRTRCVRACPRTTAVPGKVGH